MERRNARSVLGNHDLFLLVMVERSRGPDQLGAWRTRDGLSIEDLWPSRRGDWADLDAVVSDAELEAWLRALPFLVEIDDGTLAQHTDDDRYAEIGATVAEVNAAVRAWLATRGGAFQSFRYTIGRHGIDDPARPCSATSSTSAFDGSFMDIRRIGMRRPSRSRRSRGRLRRSVLAFWGRAEGEEPGPIGATVALLPPLQVGASVIAACAQGWRLSISPRRAIGGSCPEVTYAVTTSERSSTFRAWKGAAAGCWTTRPESAIPSMALRIAPASSRGETSEYAGRRPTPAEPRSRPRR